MKRITLSLLFSLALTSLGAVAAFSQAKEITAKEFTDARSAASTITFSIFPRRVVWTHGHVRSVIENQSENLSRTLTFDPADSKTPKQEDIQVGETWYRRSGNEWICRPKEGMFASAGAAGVAKYYAEPRMMDGENYTEYRYTLVYPSSRPDQPVADTIETFLLDSKERFVHSSFEGVGTSDYEYDVKIDPIVAPKGLKCKK